MILLATLSLGSILALIACIIAAASFVFTLYQVQQGERRAAGNAEAAAKAKAAQLQAVGIVEVQKGLDSLTENARETRAVIYDLAVEMSRQLDNGPRLDVIVERARAPVPEPPRLHDPLHRDPV